MAEHVYPCITRKELRARFRKRNSDFTEAFCTECFDMIVEELFEAVASGRLIYIKHFGLFKYKSMSPRGASHPVTSEFINLPATMKIRFEAAKAMKLVGEILEEK